MQHSDAIKDLDSFTRESIQDGRLSGDDMDRRAVLRAVAGASVGIGFAAAVQPVSAQTLISTPVDGLSASVVSVNVNGFPMPAYRAFPVSQPGAPVVLVISEIFGVHEHIADVVRRFAKQGYYAIAPEMFVRQGDAKAYTDIAKLQAEVITKVPDAQAMGDLDACVAFAKGEGADVARLAVTGFCWGGRITWLYAAHRATVKAGVAWYGRLVGQASALNPRHPIDLVHDLKAPVLGLYGDMDGGIPVASVDQMQAALANGNAAAKASEIILFPDAPHAFHADYRPSYRKAAAEEGWTRCLAWFQAKLG